jgi:twitching motility protein PilT
MNAMIVQSHEFLFRDLGQTFGFLQIKVYNTLRKLHKRSSEMSVEKQKVQKRLNSWLNMLIETGGADLHIKTNCPIRARFKSEIVLLSKEVVTSETMELLVELLTGDEYEKFENEKEFDSAYSLDTKYRFRINLYMHVNGYAIVFRLIPPHIKTIEELNLPPILHQLTHLRRGLVLITGTTGSGKSTTLASIIEEINQTYNRHIITIEDPVEYIYHDKKSIIEQRQVGVHTNSFSRALRAAMREDPDIIVVGEIRDLATASTIVEAVNTGHLVFSTAHTLDARETVERMISIFPAEEQNRVRAVLASSLEAVISQRLVKGVTDEMIPAVEMMFTTPLIKEMIRMERDNELPDAMKKDTTNGSITFNQALFNLALSQKITEYQAYEYATSQTDLKLMFTMSPDYVNKKRRRRRKTEEEKEVWLKE